jgi:hypothetical protein
MPVTKCLPELRTLNHREEKLCEEVIARGFRDSVGAYLAAGYKTTSPNAIVLACKKIHEPKIQRRINELIALKKVKTVVTTERQLAKLERYEAIAEKMGMIDTCVSAVKEENVIGGIRIAEQPANSEEAERLSGERKRLYDIGARLYIESKEVEKRQNLLSDGKTASQDAPGLTGTSEAIPTEGQNEEETPDVLGVPVEKEREE